MMDTFIGIDLGGTKLLVGEVDREGNILNHKRYESGYLDQQAAIEVIRRSLDDYIRTVGWADGTPPAGMGVGLMGRVDAAGGEWLQIDPRRTQPTPLAGILSESYGIPCRIDNDVKAATRAEQAFGYGKTSQNFIYLNIGTGIAAGVVVNGKLIRGSHFNAGEVGHTQVGVGLGLTCGCGRTDCVELIASGMGLDRCARLLVEKGGCKTSLVIPSDPGERISADIIFALCRRKDPLCVELVDLASQGLANLIMNLVRVSDPDTVVLGGGVVADGFMHGRILEKLNPTTIRFVNHGVVLTRLKPEFIGLLGAAAVAMNKNN